MSAPFTQSPRLAGIAALRHGFFGREGGVSLGEFTANNMSTSTGDAAETVEANRTGAAAALGYGRGSLVLLKQVHSPDVHVITALPESDVTIAADAMVTALPALALGILTADCAPILLADADAGIIGAAHAGWQGAVHGVIANTVAAMVGLGARAERIVTAIGPTVSGVNYEVGEQFQTDFLALHPDGSRFFHVPSGGKPHFDLPAFVAAQLAAAGVTQIDSVGGCTYGQPERYFSHRFATHRQGKTGRQVAIIGLT